MNTIGSFLIYLSLRDKSNQTFFTGKSVVFKEENTLQKFMKDQPGFLLRSYM